MSTYSPEEVAATLPCDTYGRGDFDRVDHQRAVARRIESALDEMVLAGVLDRDDRRAVRFDVSALDLVE